MAYPTECAFSPIPTTEPTDRPRSRARTWPPTDRPRLVTTCSDHVHQPVTLRDVRDYTHTHTHTTRTHTYTLVYKDTRSDRQLQFIYDTGSGERHNTDPSLQWSHAMGTPSHTEDLQRKTSTGDSTNTKQQLDRLLQQRDNEYKPGPQLPKETEKKPPLPPDGGWGWVVVLACSVSFFVAGGFGRSFTLIYQELLAKFGESASSTATVAAVFGAVKLCSSEYRIYKIPA